MKAGRGKGLVTHYKLRICGILMKSSSAAAFRRRRRLGVSPFTRPSPFASDLCPSLVTPPIIALLRRSIFEGGTRLRRTGDVLFGNITLQTRFVK